jgi:[acyl-carrier-protein] S-malonyltransferase
VTYALIFAGQGTQHPGMFPWLSDDPGAPSAEAVAAMNAALGRPWRQVLEDADLRHRNAIAQVLITGTSLAAWSLLAPHVPQPPAVVAGYSVGELAASGCAGALALGDAVALAAERAACMDDAAAQARAALGQGGGLLSVSGVTEAAMGWLCPALQCAIRIAEDHAIWGGLESDLGAATAALAALGAVCKRLEIGVASHTSQMRGAAQRFTAALAQRPWRAPDCGVVLNADATLCRQSARLQAGLARQLDHTIDWAACMDTLAERGIRCVLEIGPGSPLSALWNRRHAAIPARALADFQGSAGAADWIRAQLR